MSRSTNMIPESSSTLFGDRRMHALVGASAVDTIVIDAEGILLDAIRSAHDMSVLGYEASELLGKNILPLVHPDDLASVQEALLGVARQPGSSAVMRFRCRHLDGSWKHLQAIGTNRIDDPNIGGIVVNYHDVTGSVRVERRQRVLLDALSDVDVGIVVLEGERVRFANEAFCRMSQYTSRELSELSSALEIICEDDRDRLRDRLGQHLAGRNVRSRYEVTLTRKDGTPLDVEIAFRGAQEDDRDQLIATIHDITERRQQERIRETRIASLQTEVGYLRRNAGVDDPLSGLVGRSAAMRRVIALIERAMDVDVTVLISGETGTGKELVARAIHAGSTRRAKPLIPVNCAAIPRELLASELFGYRKGAFTGAFEDRPGLFETVSGGTLLLDEIGDMPLDAQVFLLRALQERKIQRLGDEMHLRDVDVRVLAATNRNLEADVESGRFRKDLFYRLNLFPITIPPLCERPDDIPLLADLFIRDACREFDRAVDGIAPEALNALQAYPWHGNVRQLQNEIQRAVVLSSDGAKLGLAHFSPEIVRAPA
ncbi:sigma-54-dependent Fis family transcriptional regulator, partial [Candidatus Poribacteria bacterium]|nr:sigma-54-dependent Fis family transcriptional regulator [Candidatus Poribacteria bacterium]